MFGDSFTADEHRAAMLACLSFGVFLVLGLLFWGCGHDSVAPPTSVAEPTTEARGTGEKAEGEDPPGYYDIKRMTPRAAERVSCWCVYQVISISPAGGECPLKVGEMICLACPAGGACPAASGGGSVWFGVHNPLGDPTGVVQAVYVGSDCRDYKKYRVTRSAAPPALPDVERG